MQKLLMLLAVLLCMSCGQRDEMPDLAEGRLELSIGQVSLSTETRATPSELGKPLADEFALQIQRSGTAVTEYKGKFKESIGCLLYTSPSPRDRTRSRMPSSA